MVSWMNVQLRWQLLSTLHNYMCTIIMKYIWKTWNWTLHTNMHNFVNVCEKTNYTTSYLLFYLTQLMAIDVFLYKTGYIINWYNGILVRLSNSQKHYLSNYFFNKNKVHYLKLNWDRVGIFPKPVEIDLNIGGARNWQLLEIQNTIHAYIYIPKINTNWMYHGPSMRTRRNHLSCPI